MYITKSEGIIYLRYCFVLFSVSRRLFVFWRFPTLPYHVKWYTYNAAEHTHTHPDSGNAYSYRVLLPIFSIIIRWNCCCCCFFSLQIRKLFGTFQFHHWIEMICYFLKIANPFTHIFEIKKIKRMLFILPSIKYMSILHTLEMDLF